MNFENRYRTSAGGYRWLEWSSVADGDAIYFVAKDVTARKTLEAEHDEDMVRISRSEALHRTLSANLPGSTVFLLDHDLRIVLAEGEAVRRLPWFSEDLFIGRLVTELYSSVPAHVLDLAIESYTAILQGQRRSFEFSSDGARFAVDGVPVFSDDGAVDAALIVARDVTEQWQLTDGLRRSEERLLKAEGLVGGGSWELELDEQTVMWSDGLGHIHGDAPVGGREPLSTYVERVLPADRAHFRDELARCEEAGRAAFEYRVTRPDGGIRTLTVEAEMADPSGGESRPLRGAVLDVTDERAGFDAAPIGMLVADPAQLRIVRANDALCSMLGREREELLGMRIEDLTHPDDRALAADNRQALVAGRQATYQAEKRYLRPDGSVVWVAVYVTAVHDTDGSVSAFSTQVIDITERKERDAERNAAREESLRRLAIAGEYSDEDTHEHTARVGRVAVELGKKLGLAEADLDLLRQAAPLHDIGKIGISDLILLKPGRLSAEERVVMERHTRIGADILANSDSAVLQMAEEIALTHHERWDGVGYPRKLRGESIPLVGRVVAVADVFDALTHSRPYKEAWSVERAVEHIRGESGQQFDPSVVSAFSTLDHTSLARLEEMTTDEAHPPRAYEGRPHDSCTFAAGADERNFVRDQAAADRDRAASARDLIAAGRDESEADADRLTSIRDHAASERDHAASERDQTAFARDRSQAKADRARGASDCDHTQADADQRTSDRTQAAAEREHTAADSVHTAADRDQAHAEADQRDLNREQSAADRVLAAADRDQSAEDRIAATTDRDSARHELMRAQTDQLTGALGRELGMITLGREINRARHGNGKLVLAFADLDGLKQVNDRQGHAAGDLLLQRVVGALQMHLRSYDPIVRVGGDEFICALADATPAEVSRRFEAIRATIGATHPNASISVGLAELRPGDTLEQLVERGDAALYRAKGASAIP